MSRILTISDKLYTRLELAAQERGLANIEQLLESWLPDEQELARRRETVQSIDALRQRLFANYGEMTDSVELLRNKRNEIRGLG